MLGLLNREGEELSAEFPDARSSPRLTQWSRMATAGGAPIGVSMWGQPTSHIIIQGQDSKSILLHFITQGSHCPIGACGHSPRYTPSFTVTHKHTPVTAFPCHPQAYPITQNTDSQAPAVKHRHIATHMHCYIQDTWIPPIFHSLGWEGIPGTVVSILLLPDRSTSLGPDRGSL